MKRLLALCAIALALQIAAACDGPTHVVPLREDLVDAGGADDAGDAGDATDSSNAPDASDAARD
jgi:hypothetical protein